MKRILRFAVLMTAMSGSVTAYGQKFEKNVLWDATLNYGNYRLYKPDIWPYRKYLKIYDAPPENLWLDLGLARYEERSYEFHKLKDEFKEYASESYVAKSWMYADTLYYTVSKTVYRNLTCKIVKSDTVVIMVNGKSIDKCKLSEYMDKAPITSKFRGLKEAQNRFAASRKAYLEAVEECKRFNAKVQVEYERDSILAANSLALLERKIDEQYERQRREYAEKEALAARKKIMKDLEADISDPAKPLLTKTYTNAVGSKVTYQYYVNDKGYEVKHGKFTETRTFNNYRYWSGMSQYGWVYLDGTESCTRYYKNGILHGRITYSSNISSSSTFGNDGLLKNNISFDVYKGVISGDFKFTYKGITYAGKATNGILDYCDYATNDGYHGKLTSNSSGNEFSIAVINNGYREFEFDAITDWPTVCCSIPTVYFPRIGE